LNPVATKIPATAQPTSPTSIKKIGSYKTLFFYSVLNTYFMEQIEVDAPHSVVGEFSNGAPSRDYLEGFSVTGEFISDALSEDGPGDSYALAFAHYNNRIAYWWGGGTERLMVADYLNQHPKTVFEDEGRYNFDESSSTFSLYWTSDDLHLILNVLGDTDEDLIYHVQTDSVEPWNYECDRLAVSPKSGKLATWCSPHQKGGKFAVIEWGGEIWYSDSAPKQERIQNEADLFSAWQWSPDGEKVAFFQLADGSGDLYITDAQGNPVYVLPKIGRWLFQYDSYPWSFQSVESDLIQWTSDSNTLLIRANGDPEHPCPDLTSEDFDGNQIIWQDMPCWQVVDLETGKVVWSISDAFPILELSGGTRLIFEAAISPTDHLLVIYDQTSRRYDVIDLDRNKVIHSGDMLVNQLHWGTEGNALP
jgi:hypothetical protein